MGGPIRSCAPAIRNTHVEPIEYNQQMIMRTVINPSTNKISKRAAQ